MYRAFAADSIQREEGDNCSNYDRCAHGSQRHTQSAIKGALRTIDFSRIPNLLINQASC